MWFKRLASQAVATVVVGLSSVVFGAGSVVYVDDDAPQGGDGASWDTAYRFLQDGLTDAANGGVAEIHVAQGIYKPDRDEANPDGTGDREASFHLINGVALMGGYAGIEAKNPDARDIELYETVLSGDLIGNDEPDFANYEENSYHVTMGSNNDNTALLEGFTVTAGNANGANPNDRGGGFYATPTDAMIALCKFESNFCSLLGGGVYSLDGSLNLLHSTFVGNKAGSDSPACGGGMYIRFDTFGAPTVDSCNFIGNSSTRVGGGLECVGTFEDGATISNCTFENNTAIGASNSATGGGGMIIFNSTSEMQIVNCTFINNSTINTTGFGVGGGLALSNSDCRVLNCDFFGNSSSGKIGSMGGAAEVQFENPQFVNCLAVGNSADFGGGFDNLGADPRFLNCTVTANIATISGGAVHSRTFGDHETLLTNCIMWDNGPEPIVDEEDAVTIVNYSNVQSGWTGAGSNNIDADPMFVNPGSGDYRLASGSPCIDAGNNWGVPIDENDYDKDGILCEQFPVDLDGNRRFNADEADFDPGCGVPVVVDMGAYEYQFDPADQVTFADLNADGAVGVADLLGLLASWGPCAKGCCLADLDIDGNVGISDLLALLANWGPCP